MAARHNLVHLTAVLCCCTIATAMALPPSYPGDLYEHHAPPATSYATISTTHVKVQHPPAAHPKYQETLYKYEQYLTKPLQPEYKYISLPASAYSGKFEDANSTPDYKYLAASPTYKYVQPPAVSSEPEEEGEDQAAALKYAYKYENLYKDPSPKAYEQPAVQYKYIAVPSYKYVSEPKYDYGNDDKQQY